MFDSACHRIQTSRAISMDLRILLCVVRRMNLVIKCLVFCIVLFIYLHVFFHLKTSDDLEIYEIDQPSKERLEEICDQRQPVIFDYPNERMLDMCRNDRILSTYGAFDIKLRDVSVPPSDDMELYVPISLSSGLNAVSGDGASKFLSENNSDFLEETGLIKTFRYNDAFLRPYMVSNCAYDYTTASQNCRTPFRYDLGYRNYFLVTNGEVKIKLSPPKSAKYLHPQNDYERMEFRSPVNPWDVQMQYRPDFDKVKCLEVTVSKGQAIYIPAYWWHSLQYAADSSVCTFKYRTYMNTIAILPRLCMSFLQKQNVKHKVAQEIDVSPVVETSAEQPEANDPKIE